MVSFMLTFFKRGLLPLSLLIFSVFLSFNLFSSTTFTSKPVSGSIFIKPTIHPGTTLDLGILGNISFKTHKGFFKVILDINSLSPNDAEKFIKEDRGLSEYKKTLPDDIRRGIRVSYLKGSFFSLLIFLFLLSLRKFSIKLIIYYLTITTLLLSLLSVFSFLTYDPKAIKSPKYSGLVSLAPKFIGSTYEIANNFNLYRDQMARLLENASNIYNLASDNTIPEIDNSLKILHVSDLHLNPQGFELINSIIKNFKVDLIVDTGDITDFGSSYEDLYLKEITRLDIPYIFVKGNHDSTHTEDVIRRFKNATVLSNGEIFNFKGVTFVGYKDPTYTADKSEKLSSKEVMMDTERIFNEVKEKEIDFLLYHDPTYLDIFKNNNIITLSGHWHRASFFKYKNFIKFISGSTGGGGLRTVRNNKSSPLEARIIYYDVKGKGITAYDDISMGGMDSSSLLIKRNTI